MRKCVPPYEYTSGVGSLEVVEKPTLKGIWMLLRPGVDKDYIDASSKGFNNSDMTEMNYMPQLWEVYLRDIKDIRSHDLTTRQSLFFFLHYVRHWFPITHGTHAAPKLVVEKGQGPCKHQLALLIGPFFNPCRPKTSGYVPGCLFGNSVFMEVFGKYYANQMWLYMDKPCKPFPILKPYPLGPVNLSQAFLNRIKYGTELDSDKGIPKYTGSRLVSQTVDCQRHNHLHAGIRASMRVVTEWTCHRDCDCEICSDPSEYVREATAELDDMEQKFKKIMDRTAREDSHTFAIIGQMQERQSKRQTLKSFFTCKTK